MKIDSNPSIKPFHEIYKTVAQEYNESPLAKKFLGTLQKGTYKRGHKEVESFGKTGKDYKNQGIRFFEELRNFSANTAKIFVEEILKERLSRPNKAEKKSWSNRGATEIAAFEKETLADANQMSLFAEGKITKGEAKYGAKNLDRNEVLLDIEKIRYMRLMISAIVTALVKPIFEADKEKLELLLRVYPMFQDPNLKYLMTADARTTFVEGVIETTEFQLTHGIEIFDVERLKKEIAMAKARKRGK